MEVEFAAREDGASQSLARVPLTESEEYRGESIESEVADAGATLHEREHRGSREVRRAVRSRGAVAACAQPVATER